jgi:hypothetical protein
MGNAFATLLNKVTVGNNTLTTPGRQVLLNNCIPISSEEFDYTLSDEIQTTIITSNCTIQPQDDEKKRYSLALDSEDLIICFNFNNPLKSRQVNVFITSTEPGSESLQWETRRLEIGADATWCWNFSRVFRDMIESSASMKVHIEV